MVQRALEWLCLPFRSRRRALAILLLLVLIGFGVWFSGRHLWAEHHYRSARKALERYRLAEAQEQLEKCLQAGFYEIVELGRPPARSVPRSRPPEGTS